jgi:hypothetical protein
MQIAFGKNHAYQRADLVIVSIGMGLYLSAATLNQAALAKGQVRRASLCWIGCAVAFVIWMLIPLCDNDFHRVEVGYLGRPPALRAALLALPAADHATRERVEPGSTEEMELQLASADEAG